MRGTLATAPSATGLFAFALMAACSTPHADEARPGLNDLLGGATREAWASPTPQGESTDGPFWQAFGDPILDGLVAEALEHNHDLKASAARLGTAAARGRIARSARRPNLDARAGYQRQKNLFIGFPIPGTSGPASSTFDQWNAGLDLSWELDLWGKLAAGVEASDAEFDAALGDLAGARLSIAAQVASAWFGLREAHEQRELAEATQATFERSAAVVRDRFDAGLSGALDLRLAESNVATSQAGTVAAERAERVASRQIELLLGRFPAAELQTEGSFVELPGKVPAGLPAELLARRPDLFAAERRMAAAEALAKQARLDRWPSIALTASGGTTSDEVGDLLDGDFSVWSLAGRITGPLFDGGRRKAQITQSLEQLREARAGFASLALQAFFEVENTLDAEGLLIERLGHLERAMTAARAATALADEQYAEGLVSIELVLESQRRQFGAESSFLAARRELFQNRVELHVALGGGFEAPESAVDGDEVSEESDDDSEAP